MAFANNVTIGKSSFPVKIPSCIRSGYYLLRAEHIALHSASTTGGAQFYVSCAQLGITGGGNSEPPNKVAFPGAYDPNHPGIKININYVCFISFFLLFFLLASLDQRKLTDFFSSLFLPLTRTPDLLFSSARE
jgi:Auxiliary Activity family 9 (formerly GH61)